ncbi:hypothetical protein A1A1_13497 [Planococcus antarcticus DSM 14505]|uniref:ABC transporter permease n=1 Tax=Planococcus antarcticus DSM 14505 TaxID=1185653 RepID=A0A1C7DKN8_9BACL|nr:hypothetical protein [Planococcus antarcticus]ANU11948.1 hypothetical protein BBH88_17660 [Planococcus antarcticus DSM 14505]EIM05962.1 hypothetical protein A1A1_13497 [Planococcus antarcticus DSM 14505]
MREFKSLKILSAFKSIFTKLGVDYAVMEKILQIKLTMDERRVPTIFGDSGKKKEGNQFLKSLWVYGLYSLILIPFLLLGENYIFQMSLVFGIVLFILMTSMISDFSVVLLDVRDKNILQTKPINRKTIAAAKIVHIMIYMAFVAGAFTAIPFLVGLFKHGMIFSLIFLIELVLTILLVVVLTSLLYLFILRFFDGEKLKDIINYVQILLSVGVVVGYQVLIRSFEFVDLNMIYSFSWWHFLIPSLWYGAPFEVFLTGNSSVYLLAFTMLAVLVPIIAIYGYAKLMPSFERNLEKLLNDTKTRKQKRNWPDEIEAKLFCRSKEERTFFRFAASMMKKEREFKLKVFPALGMSIFFPFLFIFTYPAEGGLEEISGGNMFLFIYFCNFMIPSFVYMLRFSEGYKGSWIFKAAPIEQISRAYSGALKAFFVKLYLPVFIVVSFVFIWIFTARILPDLAAVFLGGLLQTLFTHKMVNEDEFPFSTSFEFTQDAGGAKMLLLTLITGVFIGAHFIANLNDYGIYIYLVILVATLLIGWQLIFPRNRKRKSSLALSRLN